ncbi:MAG: YdeI/OmpD-associated family protein [Sphingomicrobium sp.]
MNRDPRVDAYLAAAPPFAQPILEHVRTRVHAALPAVKETIKWRMPTFTVGGQIVLITAAFKAHCALNFWRGQELESRHSSVGALGQFGKIKSIAELPGDDELDRLVREAAELASGAPAPRQPKHQPRPPADIHPDFAAALGQAPQAQAVLDGFPASARRDYVDWIAEAKQDATRAKRIASAIEWLGEGKRRHWKYENC